MLTRTYIYIYVCVCVCVCVFCNIIMQHVCVSILLAVAVHSSDVLFLVECCFLCPIRVVCPVQLCLETPGKLHSYRGSCLYTFDRLID